MSSEEIYVGRVSSALERMLGDQGDDWRAQAREVDRRLFQADVLWGHGDFRAFGLTFSAPNSSSAAPNFRT